MKKKGVLFITFALVFALLLSTVSISAALAKGWADIDGVKKNGGTIKGTTSFKVFYTASRQGTYKADLYQIYPNDKSKKDTYIKTVSFNCNKKIKVKGQVRYKGTATVTNAKKNTYYQLLPQAYRHNPSYYGKTKKK